LVKLADDLLGSNKDLRALANQMADRPSQALLL